MFKYLKNDLPASIVVFFVALPLCLGIALASGAPLFSGLISGIVGGIVVGAMSGSQIGVSGPAAGLAAIVLTAIGTLGGYQNFLLAVVLGGAIQLLFGVLKAGVIAYYFPSSVIKGMLTGIGIIIILKQIPHFFGYDVDPEGDFAFIQVDGENTFSEIFMAFNNISPGATTVAINGLVILLLWDKVLSKKGKVFQLIQGPLVAVVVGIIFTYLLVGIGLGLLVGIVVILIKSYQNSHFLHKEREDIDDGKIKMTLAEEVTFFNKGAILKELDKLHEDSYLELDVRKTRYLDNDIIEILDDFSHKAKLRNITIKLISERGTLENPASYIEFFKLRPKSA